MAKLRGILLFFLLSGLLTAFFWKAGHRVWPSKSLPPLTEGWWAKVDKKDFKENPAIRPFKISVKDNVLTDLKTRLENTRLSEPLQDIAFQYGFNTNYLKEVKTYWLDKYDWRKEEARLNKFDGFVTQLEGIDVHFLHVKPKNVPSGTKVVPLMMVHGWPGSLVEFYKIIPMLTQKQTNKDFVFEVICPHIPGYGFSEAPHRSGFGPFDAAKMFHSLMLRLGHSKYFVHGGDWGSMITTYMAMIHPESVRGLHVTMATVATGGQWIKLVIGDYLPFLVVEPDEYSAVYPLAEKTLFIIQESGYMHIQATKPDTVGVALGDSPLGLAAYILEKFSTWTDPNGRNQADGDLTKKFTLEELLTNVMVYWVTNSITSSVRFYKEFFNDNPFELDTIPVTVPTGIADLPNELMHVPRSLVEHRFTNIVQYSKMPRGGHFGSMEEPQLIADDVTAFVQRVLGLEQTAAPKQK